MSFKETIDFVWTTWESGGVVMFPLILVAFLIYSVAVHLLLSLMRRSFRNLDDGKDYTLNMSVFASHPPVPLAILEGGIQVISSDCTPKFEARAPTGILL